MAEEKAKVSGKVSTSKVEAPVIEIADPPAPAPVVKVVPSAKGKTSEKATRGTLDKI